MITPTITPQEAVAVLRKHGTVSRRGDTYTVNLLHGGGARQLDEAALIALATARVAKDAAIAHQKAQNDTR